MAKRPLINKAFKPQTNETILAGIRKTASDTYRERVTPATQANIEKTMNELATYKPTFNEFQDSLVNLIGDMVYRNRVWSNPLSIFKGPMLQFGDTIEEVATGLIKAHVYDPNGEYMERMLFGQHRPDTVTSFHRINRQDFYPVSINRDILRRAFYSEYGLSDFISGIMDAPATSDNVDEFVIMTNLFREFERNNGFFRRRINSIQDIDWDAEDDGRDETTAKRILRQLRADAKSLGFVSTAYNAAGVPSFALPSDMILIATPEFQAAIDVEGLAPVFNLSYADIPYRIVTFPREQMPEGVEAILTSEDIFMVRDTLLESTRQENAVGLFTNYYTHHHGIYSLSRFVPAIAYVLDNPTVIELDNSPVTGVSAIELLDGDGNPVTQLVRGENFIVRATATTEGVNDAVEYSLAGNTDPRTRVWQSGIGHIDEREASDSVVITATALDDRSFTATKNIPIVGNQYVEWPNPSVKLDQDNDGLEEVEPKKPAQEGAKVTVPSGPEGIQYRKAGANVAYGSEHTITGDTVFVGVAKAGYEIPAGTTTSWTFKLSA